MHNPVTRRLKEGDRLEQRAAQDPPTARVLVARNDMDNYAFLAGWHGNAKFR